jgi:hypothetical protein
MQVILSLIYKIQYNAERVFVPSASDFDTPRYYSTDCKDKINEAAEKMIFVTQK